MPKTKRVLAVDDDVSLINMLRAYLPQVLEIELLVAPTGENALEIIQSKEPDIVLLDMQLPGMQGPEVLSFIRERYPKMKVLVITSYDKQVKGEMARLGVDGFFPKPVVLTELVDRIKDVLSAKDVTLVKPVSLADVRMKEDVVPFAKIMFIESEFCMPYLLPIVESADREGYPIKGYGDYEFKCVYCQKDVQAVLKSFKPDVVICATDVPDKEPFTDKTAPMADTMLNIMKSKYAPKAMIAHGSQQSIASLGIAGADIHPGMWVEKVDMFAYDPEKDKENVERLNKMLWSVCFKHNLVKKVK
ncbi:MAG: response regulator [Candidatus Omnitrophica bacterium]|nr:response regulator [Candidatus Omnitrophota bacterium]